MNRNIDIETGLRLKAIREYRNMTQKDVAAGLGCPQSMICQYEKGRRAISLPLLLRFCEVLKVDLGCFDTRKNLCIIESQSVTKHPQSSELASSQAEQ